MAQATMGTTNNNATTRAKKTNESSLYGLTERFVEMLKSSSKRQINLTEASTRLNVAKRRIYDITNVLEGIGLLDKASKGLTCWVDCRRDNPLARPPTTALTTTTNNTTTDVTTNQVDFNKQSTGGGGIVSSDGFSELEILRETHQRLVNAVNDLEANIRQQLGAEGAYVTYHDIKSFFNDQIVIALKAPPDTRLEVNESSQIWMKSENGEIEVYLCPQHANSNTNNSNTSAQQQNHGYQTNTSPHLQQSQLSNSSNTQPLDATITNTTNLICPPQSYTAVSSDEGRGRSTISTTDGQFYDPSSGVSTDDHYYNNDPTLSSALSGTISEDEDPFKPLMPFEAREEAPYNFMLDDNYTITSLFPEDNLGLY